MWFGCDAVHPGHDSRGGLQLPLFCSVAEPPAETAARSGGRRCEEACPDNWDALHHGKCSIMLNINFILFFCPLLFKNTAYVRKL